MRDEGKDQLDEKSNKRRIKRLGLLDHMGHVIIPRIALSFVAIFWIIGLAKYNNPDLSLA